MMNGETRAVTLNYAARINTQTKMAAAAAGTALGHARAAGELLIEAKRDLPHGAFTPWIEQNISVGLRQARTYMTLAEGWDSLPNQQRDSALSIREALRLMAPEPVTAEIVERPQPQPEPERIQVEVVEDQPDPEPIAAQVAEGPTPKRDPITVDAEYTEVPKPSKHDNPVDGYDFPAGLKILREALHPDRDSIPASLRVKALDVVDHLAKLLQLDG